MFRGRPRPISLFGYLIHKQRFRFETLYFILSKMHPFQLYGLLNSLPKLKENSLEAQRGKVLRSQSWRSSLCGFSSLFDGTAPFVGARAFLVVVLLLTCRILKYFPYNMTTFDTSVESISSGRPAYCIQTDLNILNEMDIEKVFSGPRDQSTTKEHEMQLMGSRGPDRKHRK